MQTPANIGNYQKYFLIGKTSCNLAYQFKGQIDIQTLIDVVDLVYKHHQSFKFNLDECEDQANLQYVKNSEKYQQALDQQAKVEHYKIQNLQDELKFLHNQSPNFLRYNQTSFLPFKFLILTGYEPDQFCIYCMCDHMVFDGTNICFQINEIFQIYTKLKKGESIESHIQSLENRVILSEKQMYDTYYKNKIKFWQCFINNIRFIKQKFGDPGKVSFDDGTKVFKSTYKEIYERGSKRLYQVIQNFDFSNIFKGIRQKYQYISKNSIIQAFWLKFFDYFVINVRSKELEVDPESLRGTMAISQAYRHLPYEEYGNVQGNYIASIMHSYDVKRYENIEELALEIHKDTQKFKNSHQHATNQIAQQIYYNPDWLSQKHTYMTTSWTNLWLNQNSSALYGAQFFRQSQGLVQLLYDISGPCLNYNVIITNIGPQDEASFTYSSLNEEQNIKIKEKLAVFFQQINDEFLVKQTLDKYIQKNI